MTGTPIQLLIIEDDQVDRMACRRELALQTDTEFRFSEADTGREGLRLAQQLRPDCILLDYQLPDLSGTEVLAGLATDDGKVPVPVIMLTGADRASLAVESLRLGAQDYLVKDAERRYLKLLPTVIERALREQRLRAEKREAEERLQAVANGFPGLLSYVDRTERYRYANWRYAEWFGFAPDTLYGRTLREFLGAAYAAAQPHVQAVLAGEAREFDNTLSICGESRRLHVRFFPHTGRQREVLGFYAIALDVTEQKRAEKELQKRRSEMERLMHLHTASQTAAAIAHELNQPLNAVAAYTEASLRMLRGGGTDMARVLHALEQSTRQVQRVGNVMRELLAFLYRGEVATEALDFNATIRDAVAQCEAADCLNGHLLRLVLAADLPRVRGNHFQTEKVVVNLLQNAGDALRAAGVADAAVTVHTSVNDDGWVQASVEDTGPGLPREMLERIFDPFFTTKPDGLGMGLALSRALIEAQGGRLWAEPCETGTRFSFTLPSDAS